MPGPSAGRQGFVTTEIRSNMKTGGIGAASTRHAPWAAATESAVQGRILGRLSATAIAISIALLTGAVLVRGSWMTPDLPMPASGPPWDLEVQVPAAAAVRSLLALKLFGNARHSHVMSYVLDEGLALFAGREWWFDAIFVSGMVAAALGLGLYSATRRAYLAELHDRAERLERERDQQGALAAAADGDPFAQERRNGVFAATHVGRGMSCIGIDICAVRPATCCGFANRI